MISETTTCPYVDTHAGIDVTVCADVCGCVRTCMRMATRAPRNWDQVRTCSWSNCVPFKHILHTIVCITITIITTIPLAGTEAETWHAISRLLRLSSLKDSNSHCNMEMQETDPSLPARCKLSKYGGQNNPLRRKLATTSLTPVSHLLPENFFEF